MNGGVIVRRYEPRDRAAVRQICCDTADSGAPVESFFPDREVFADLLTRYYTDLAPEASWVADQAGQVVGYLTGCFDSQRFLRAMGLRVIPFAVCKALRRGTLWHPQTVKLLRANCNRGPSRPPFNRAAVYREYPAHLHINLSRDSRGQGAGPILLERFLEQARRAQVAGVHAGVSDANPAGRGFFEKSGFVVLGQELRFRHPDHPDQPSFTLVYGKRLRTGKLS